MQIITTHDNADFDGTAAMLAAYKLYPQATPVLPRRVGRSVQEFIALYRNALPFVNWVDFRPRSVERVILVDTQRIPDIRKVRRNAEYLIFDHHPRLEEAKDTITFIGERVGAVTTLMVELIRERGDISLEPLEATLMALGIYSDTGAFTYGTTTHRDLNAAAWLLEKGAAVDTIRRFLAPPLGDRQRQLLDMLINAQQTRIIQGHKITVGAVYVDHYVEHINSVAHRLRDMLESTALFLIVGMPEGNKTNIQLVCRSSHDAINVGEVARYFGGGGHSRAAAANISDSTVEQVTNSLWDWLETHIQPTKRVADLMSLGVQTVNADDKLGDIIHSLRRIGHEGYPVLDGERVVGLLTRRDADRALEHGLRDSTVREVMLSGQVKLTPDDPISKLEQLIVESTWGQIPVVDKQDRLIGIVTRTDLIKHWVATHPATASTSEVRIQPGQITAVLGQTLAKLIQQVAQFAQERHLNIYLVGGVVRDLLLNRPNYDIDFVVEGDAITFAEAICAEFGGEVSSFRPFGTAKWKYQNGLPGHIDFASSRNEFYVHPTALPSVYRSSIKLDLHRRDFTINTLAIQLSPANAAHRLLDFYGGLHDLERGVIRVLHSLSFIDDPTRMLRAVRFEKRLGFQIEPRTAELIKNALPMLARITGERVRNEIKHILKENQPENALTSLQERGILKAIHPDLRFDEESRQDFVLARQTELFGKIEKMRHLYWHLIMARIQPEKLQDLGERLHFGNTIIKSYISASKLVHEPGVLIDPNAPISQITRHLDGIRDVALMAAWIICKDLRRERIQQYIETWRHISPITTGHTLKSKGLPPGPRYRAILERLRDARLDGEIQTDEQENALLEQLIANDFSG
ncbi:MAG: CBS domain-containing protein [Chloroflexi bacterium]|nr:MAG: CBS domain-containing protein [Chloroflexota bacterium]